MSWLRLHALCCVSRIHKAPGSNQNYSREVLRLRLLKSQYISFRGMSTVTGQAGAVELLSNATPSVNILQLILFLWFQIPVLFRGCY
jgi:hypothetical protein